MKTEHQSKIDLWDGRSPDPQVIGLAKLLQPPATILDIGANQGRHAVWLANQGFRVTAVEPNHEALELIRVTPRSNQENLDLIESSLIDYQSSQLFDAVICTYVLHFLSDQTTVQTSIQKLQDWTRPGGYAIVSAYTTKNPPGKRPYLFAPNELRNAYRNWNIVEYVEQPTPWFIMPPGTPPRRNHEVVLFAQKPQE